MEPIIMIGFCHSSFFGRINNILQVINITTTTGEVSREFIFQHDTNFYIHRMLVSEITIHKVLYQHP